MFVLVGCCTILRHFFTNVSPDSSHQTGDGDQKGGDGDQKGTLPPIHNKHQKNMKPFKFRSKNFGLHSTIANGFNQTHYGGGAQQSKSRPPSVSRVWRASVTSAV